MGQKPAANELTLELEPVVADNLAVFLEHADEWYAHDYVPFDQGENFAFLGGQDWDPSQVTLPGDVVDALEAQFESEIPSQAIGEGVMQRLRHVDQVAYVRFASIYKQFRDVAEFVDEVSALGKKSPKDADPAVS